MLIQSSLPLACWGENVQGEATPPAGTFSQVSAGAGHTCGVRTDGTLACWGANDHGEATPPSGTIVIVKATDPAGGTGFGFTDNIAAPNSFSLDDGGTKTFSNVFTDSYTVIEENPAVTPGGFALTDLACTDPDGGSSVDLSARKATIDLDAGETVTCTFTNTAPETPTPTPTVTRSPTPTPGPTRTLVWGPGWHNETWTGASTPEEAFACAAGRYAAAYRLVDSGWERYFPDRPDTSNMGPLEQYDAFLILLTEDVTCQMPAAKSPGNARTLSWSVGWHNEGWTGRDNTAPQDAFACAAGSYAAAYRLVGGRWERYFPGRPDISNMAPLNKYDAFLILLTAPVNCTMPIGP